MAVVKLKEWNVLVDDEVVPHLPPSEGWHRYKPTGNFRYSKYDKTKKAYDVVYLTTIVKKVMPVPKGWRHDPKLPFDFRLSSFKRVGEINPYVMSEEKIQRLLDVPESDNPEVKYIGLGGGKYAIVDAEDYERLITTPWSLDAYGYPRRRVSPRQDASRTHSKSNLMHREILGLTDPKVQIDHINGNPLDNRKSNLRIASFTENMRNRRKHETWSGVPTSSKYKGVTWNKANSKWIASVGGNGSRRYLGGFTSEEDAARAYDRGATELFGEFARLNFPEDEEKV